MCLSTVYDKTPTDDRILLRNVQKITVSGDTLILTDLLEREISLSANLISADLVNGCVIVDAHGAPAGKETA